MIEKNQVIVITGCGGMLGEGVYKQLKDRCIVHATDINVNEPWLERLDVSSKRDVDAFLTSVKPDYIVHLAALTDMEYCEMNPAHAYAVNAGGVDNMATYAKTHNIPLVYISTAGIFDGEKEEYYEYDIPNPASVYGKSKYSGELIAKSLHKSIVIRAGWMMGGGPKKDKKFINKIIKQIRTGAREIAVVDDKLGTPCYTYDLARSIEYLLDNNLYGVYHGACDGGGSRYDVAELLLSHLDLPHPVTLRKVDSSHFKENYFAPRPRSEKLINTRLKEVGPHLTRDWRVCLEEYIAKFDWKLWDLNTSGMDRSFYKNYFEIEKNHWLMRGRRLIVFDLLAKYFTHKESKKVLDFGCGSGFLVARLAERGYESHGLDISSEAIDFGKRQGVNNLGVLDSHKINYPDNAFDVLFSLDVIEHLEDESWAIQELERVLKPGGIAIIMVPAFMFLWGVQDEVAHHYRRYTLPGLLETFKKSSNFQVVRKSYFNTILFLPIALVRLVSKILHIRGRESDFDINNEFLNRLLFGIFNAERRMLRSINFPFGVSILAVFRKR